MKDKILKAASSYKAGATKKQVARKLNISYSACSIAVNELVNAGLLTPTATVTAPSGRGRPATKFVVTG